MTLLLSALLAEPPRELHRGWALGIAGLNSVNKGSSLSIPASLFGAILHTLASLGVPAVDKRMRISDEG